MCIDAVYTLPDDDEFEDHVTEPIGLCRAIYFYEAQHYDELTLQPGTIEPHLNLQLGIFFEPRSSSAIVYR